MTLATLFTPAESGYTPASEFWCVARDRDPHALDLFGYPKFAVDGGKVHD